MTFEELKQYLVDVSYYPAEDQYHCKDEYIIMFDAGDDLGYEMAIQFRIEKATKRLLILDETGSRWGRTIDEDLNVAIYQRIIPA